MNWPYDPLLIAESSDTEQGVYADGDCFNEFHVHENKKPLQYGLLLNHSTFTCKERIGTTQKWPIKNTSRLEFLYRLNTVLLSGLTLQSAKSIVSMIFTAIRFSDIAKGQMVSAAKQPKVKCSSTSSTKQDFAIAIAEIFVEKKFVKWQTEDPRNVGCQKKTVKVWWSYSSSLPCEDAAWW